jgi:prepilin-type N-terminal cleavage/methylation domain-containing protein
MKNLSMRTQNNKGFTMIELALVLVIMAILGVTLKGVLATNEDTGRVASLKTMISQVKTGVGQWKPSNGVLTGLSMTQLQSIGAIPEKYGTGANISPFGGNVTVSASSSDPTMFVITTDNINNAKLGQKLVRDYTEVTTVTPTFAGSTLTITFRT